MDQGRVLDFCGGLTVGGRRAGGKWGGRRGRDPGDSLGLLGPLDEVDFGFDLGGGGEQRVHGGGRIE